MRARAVPGPRVPGVPPRGATVLAAAVCATAVLVRALQSLGADAGWCAGSSERGTTQDAEQGSDW